MGNISSSMVVMAIKKLDVRRLRMLLGSNESLDLRT